MIKVRITYTVEGRSVVEQANHRAVPRLREGGLVLRASEVAERQ